jgi:MFS transporter, FHS family, glucose/mannose:H+ symporter
VSERVQWSLIAAAYASLFALGIADNARGPLFPEILRDLSLGDAAGSWMFGVTSAGVIAGSLLLRPLLRYVSPRRLLQLSLIGLGLGLIGLGQSRGLPHLLAASSLMGIALGGLALGQNLLVQEATPLALQRRAFSGLHSMYGVASLLAPLAVALSARAGLDWRQVLLWLALPCALVTVGTQFGSDGVAEEDPPASSEGALGDVDGEPLSESGAPAPLAALVGGRLWTIAAMTGCCVVAELLLSTRIPLLLRRAGVPRETADLYLSAFFACLLVGRLVVTFVPFRGVGNRTLLAISTAASLGLFAFGVAYQPRLLPLVALTLAPCFPVATALLAEEHPRLMERGMSLLMAVTSLLLVIAHVGVGYLSEAITLRSALWLGPLALLCSGGLQLLSSRLARKA